eukprot:4376096-Amphidinium_carterae.1
MQGHDTSGAWSILRSACSYLCKHSEFGVSIIRGSVDDNLLACSDINFALTASDRMPSGMESVNSNIEALKADINHVEYL